MSTSLYCDDSFESSQPLKDGKYIEIDDYTKDIVDSYTLLNNKYHGHRIRKMRHHTCYYNYKHGTLHGIQNQIPHDDQGETVTEFYIDGMKIWESRLLNTITILKTFETDSYTANVSMTRNFVEIQPVFILPFPSTYIYEYKIDDTTVSYRCIKLSTSDDMIHSLQAIEPSIGFIKFDFMRRNRMVIQNDMFSGAFDEYGFKTVNY